MSSQSVVQNPTPTWKRAFLSITLGYVFLALLVIALGTTSFHLSNTGRAHSDELSQRLLPALQTLAGLQEATLKYNLANLEYVTGRDEETQARKLAQAGGAPQGARRPCDQAPRATARFRRDARPARQGYRRAAGL